MNERIQKLPVKHRTALEWFMSNVTKSVGWPGELPDGTLLVTKAKGIYKHEWSEYALSIRQGLGSRYDDKEPHNLSDGKWVYKYRPEIVDYSEMEAHYTNRALLKNMAEKIPLGVLVQTSPKPNSIYRVMGLGLVKRYEDEYFVIESM